MLASSARANSKDTNKLPLIAAEKVTLLDTGYYAVEGTCGHRLTVITNRQVADWENRIATKTRHRKRCWHCGNQ